MDNNRKKIEKRQETEEARSNLELQNRYEQLLKAHSAIDKEIAELESKGVTTDLEPQMVALHDYNDMKDFTQVVLGCLANVESVSIAELHRRYNLPME